MKARSLVLIALMLPGAMSAQRRIGTVRVGGRAVPPAPLPQPAPTVAKEMSYVRLPISAESYTFISYVQSPTVSNSSAAWGTMGAATRLDYRLNNSFSVTTDLTQTLLFGPLSSGSVEMGMRFHPLSQTESKFRPFVDARLGYIYSYQSFVFSPDPSAVNPSYFMGNSVGTGSGTIAGAGAEFAVSRTLALTTGLWGSRNRMQARVYSNGPFVPSSGNSRPYWMTSTRLALGIKWNPMRAVPKYDDVQ